MTNRQSQELGFGPRSSSILPLSLIAKNRATHDEYTKLRWQNENYEIVICNEIGYFDQN